LIDARGPLFWLALVTFLGTLLVAADAALGFRRVTPLDAFPPKPDPLPSLSIVVAARDEERNIEEALRSLLALDYPSLEILAIDDRSTDRTPHILAALAADDPRLRVITVRELPPRWLGKNHALWRGAADARGELLLFTDADVVLAPTTLRRAVAALHARAVDHLVVGPELRMPGTLLTAYALSGTMFFMMGARPWKAADPRSRFHVGIGAFNLITADAYRAIGTHAAIPLRPDDDMKLGLLVKRHGLRQDFVSGLGYVAVEWYASLGEAVRGLSKNSFAALEYSVARVLGGTAAQIATILWPVAALFVTTGATRLLNAANLIVWLLLHVPALRLQRARFGHALLYPLVAAALLYALWRSMVLTLARGGIEWRGTRYPLAELRSNRL